jgi:hypothetical protein
VVTAPLCRTRGVRPVQATEWQTPSCRLRVAATESQSPHDDVSVRRGPDRPAPVRPRNRTRRGPDAGCVYRVMP